MSTRSALVITSAFALWLALLLNWQFTGDGASLLLFVLGLIWVPLIGLGYAELETSARKARKQKERATQ